MIKKLLLLLLIPSIAFGACDVPTVIEQIRPGAQWSITGNDLSSLTWLSAQPIPTQSEVDAAIAACQFALTPGQQNLKARTDAIALYEVSAASNPKLVRAVLLVLLDENNNTRQWIESFKAATAASTSLADLKTRVAALSAMPDRTATQLKTAIENKINAGAAD